ncbi:MAG: hypothetical protein CL416_00005 [Acidimicrobiaceae bacterium]|nr:hypothetical protein [Acidimicrobiaceae bacterium]
MMLVVLLQHLHGKSYKVLLMLQLSTKLSIPVLTLITMLIFLEILHLMKQISLTSMGMEIGKQSAFGTELPMIVALNLKSSLK